MADGTTPTGSSAPDAGGGACRREAAQIEGADDEAVTDGEPAEACDHVVQSPRPVMLEQDEHRGGAVRDLRQDIGPAVQADRRFLAGLDELAHLDLSSLVLVQGQRIE